MDLALNNLQRLICHKTQTAKTKKTVVKLNWEELSQILRPFQRWYQVSYKRDSPGADPFDEFLAAELGFRKFSRSSF